MPELSQRLVQQDGGQHLIIEGRLGLEAAERFHELALAAVEAEGPVVLDCSQLEHIDAASAQVLWALRCELEQARRSFTMTPMPDGVANSLRWCGLLDAFSPPSEPKS